MGRGRPKLDPSEEKRRRELCVAWCSEIKKNSGLSSKELAKELRYGSGHAEADGRAWRALASGSRAPAPANFKRMTATAQARGWLGRNGYFRYMQYWWAPSEEQMEPNGDGDYEAIWRKLTLNRALLMLMSHARKCDVDQARFFQDAREELARMESFLVGQEDAVIEQRARQIAVETTRDLLDGPEYPATSLILI